jgi:hypothetical protein
MTTSSTGLRRNVAISRHVQPGLELAFVHRRVVSKAKVCVLTIGVGPMYDESCQVIENEREVYLRLNEGPVDNVLPDVPFVLNEYRIRIGDYPSYCSTASIGRMCIEADLTLLKL